MRTPNDKIMVKMAMMTGRGDLRVIIGFNHGRVKVGIVQSVQRRAGRSGFGSRRGIRSISAS